MQRRHMEEEMAALSHQHSKRLDELIEQHTAELKKLEELKDEEIKVKIKIRYKSACSTKLMYIENTLNARNYCLNVHICTVTNQTMRSNHKKKKTQTTY